MNATPTRLPTLSYDANDSEVIFETVAERVVVTVPDVDRYFDASNFVISHERVETGVGRRTFSGDEGQHLIVGEGNTARDVYHWVSSSTGLPGGLRVGLTVHRGPGTQSSLPHDFELDLEIGFEEVFYYLISGGHRNQAVQVGLGLWHDGRRTDSVWSVSDKSFSVIPMGYHPVLSEPLTTVSYVWAYICKWSHWEKA